MYSSEIKIPKQRIAILIGKERNIKKWIEKAIGRGFNPDIAMSLAKEENYLEIIEINNFAKGSAKKMMRLKSRLIGSNGTARKNVEIMTNTNIVIYGKTVGIIGKAEDVALARNAIEKLLLGAPHGNVYRYIEMQKKRFREIQ